MKLAHMEKAKYRALINMENGRYTIAEELK
jgi:hypothetical protein